MKENIISTKVVTVFTEPTDPAAASEIIPRAQMSMSPMQ